MLIRIGYSIKIDFSQPTAMINLLHIYPNCYQLVQPEKLRIEPSTYFELFIDNFGNRCTRLLAPSGLLWLESEAIVEVERVPEKVNWEAKELAWMELPLETLQFLHPSRYCDMDRLENFAWKQFGHLPPGYSRVQAICDWVHHHIKFGYKYARCTKTAYDVLHERKGVCRDFTHLAIALCRSLGIPARYVTGYLGDIDVPPDPNPMDFSAWMEVFLSDGWYTFDPRNNETRVGRIVIAYGRDAADVAITTTFGPHKLKHFSVCTEEVLDM